jgi:hypothetical protein
MPSRISDDFMEGLRRTTDVDKAAVASLPKARRPRYCH